MHVVIVSYPLPAAARTPAALLEQFHSLTGWSEALVAAGARVTVAQRFHYDAELQRAGVRYLFVRDGARPLPRAWQIPRRLHRAALAAMPDLVHLQGLIFPLQTRALRAALPARAALAVQHHAGDPPTPNGPRDRLRLALARLGLAAADGFLFTCEELASPWRAAGIVRAGQPVYPVLEASTALRAPAKPAAQLRGAPALLWVGRLHPVKDPLTVLEGFARALPALPGAVLSMAYGSEELLAAVRERAARPDLAGRVELLGRLPQAQLANYYAAADLFVLGSRREGSGYALIEALACGLPPAVTAIPAFRAVTGDSVGAHWPPGDAASCARAITAVVKVGREAGRAAALQRFGAALSWEQVGRDAVAAYADLRGRQCASR